jgi:hypothetical protein
MHKLLGYIVALRFVDFRLAAMFVGFGILLVKHLAFAGQLVPDEVFGMLGMTEEHIGELAKGKAVAYTLEEGSADELAIGVAQFLPVPSAKMVGYLRQDGPDTMDVEVSAHG